MEYHKIAIDTRGTSIRHIRGPARRRTRTAPHCRIISVKTFPTAPARIEVEQFPNGHSNLVYLVRTDRREYVLRRPPLGPVAPKAHDMAREYRVLHAVHPYFPGSARRCFCCAKIPPSSGGTFFLMERRHGMVIRDSIPPELAAIPDYPRRVSEAFIDCLVRLHSIDVSRPELSSLGRPEGFVERQVRGWAERWNRAKTEELPKWIALFAGCAIQFAALGGSHAGAQRLQARQCHAASRRTTGWKQCSTGR